MTRPSFLARTTLGQRHDLLLAMAAAFVLALIPGGARRALNDSSNEAASWLPSAYNEVQDLQWFCNHFGGEEFALVTWDGCTLGNPEPLKLLAKKLRPTADVVAKAGPVSAAAQRAGWYARVVTGPDVLRQLMRTQVGLSYAAAIKRLEGALVGPPQRDAQGRTLGNESRTTCLVVYLSDAAMQDHRTMRDAVAGISQVAAEECGIDPATIHMGGPPVDNASIDAEGQRTLLRLAPLAGLVGVGLCYWRLRSARLSAIVFAVGIAGAGLSLAIVFYFGVIEVVVFHRPAPAWGSLDAVLLAMPAVIYLLSVSSALHAMNYYLETRRELGAAGAAERMASLAWKPALLAALATAAGLAALGTSDVAPIQRFGLFAGLSLVATVGLLLLMAPVLLHRFPLSDAAMRRRTERRQASRLTEWSMRAFQPVIDRPIATIAACVLAMAIAGAGMFQLDAQVQILRMLDPSADLVKDYTWIEQHIGNLVPMEVVLTMPPERLRTGDEHAEHDGQQYRLTMLERLELLRQIERRLEEFPQISRALSAGTFTPPVTRTGLDGANRGGDYAKNKALEYHRDLLVDGEYLRMERDGVGERTTGRELWRLSARVAALSADGQAIDYGKFLGQLKQAVEPVLWSYQQRDLVVRALHEQGKRLAGARVCVLFRAPRSAVVPPENVQEHALAELLSTSGVAPRGVSYFNLATFEHPGRGNPARNDEYRRSALASLRKQDAVILASAPSDPAAAKIAEGGVYIVDVTELPAAAESTAAPLADDGGPRPIRAVFTGLAPVVEQTQRQLLASVRRGLAWAAALVAAVLTLGLSSFAAGPLAAASALLPLVVTFGALGWLGVNIDLGLMMTAAVALGAAVEGTIHFINWHRAGIAAGLNRREATLHAYDRCGPAMIETAIIAGMGLSVFAFSAFTPIRQFGVLMTVMLAASLVGNLVLLPAMLASQLGWFFAPAAVRRRDPLVAKLQDRYEAWRNRDKTPPVEVETQPTTGPRGPHFVDEPAPARRTALGVSSDERRELAEGPHAALHAKLQNLRRPRAGDSPAS